jgi:hypothetical protein
VDKMQLTKDDIITNNGLPIGINIFKFQQVVEFYEKYRYRAKDLSKDYPLIFKQWIGKKSRYYDWLFSYCFKDGLK